MFQMYRESAGHGEKTLKTSLDTPGIQTVEKM
ncbi:hypothetical protein W909_08950 [Dickeya zeae EC1]|nr:hypothetical protein W909_08950 [Dickeya zeae EC1]